MMRPGNSALAVAALAVAGLAGCAAPGAMGEHRARAARPGAIAPQPDSITIALWHYDENGGQRAADAGPYRLDGTAGIDTRTDFGRFRSARVFQRTNDSFVITAYNPVLDLPNECTVEAWIWINSIAPYELQVVAARWTPAPNAATWLLGVTGQNLTPPTIATVSPGWFSSAVGIAPQQRLLFGFQPEQAGGFQGYFSTSDLPLQRWTHVAVTFDSRTVKLFIDGRIDAQYAIRAPMRRSEAPLLVGDVFDPRFLTSFGGDLRIDPSANVTTYYGFDGDIDELRISSGARTSFESAPRP